MVLCFLDGPVDVSTEPGQARVIYDRPFEGILPSYHRLDLSVDRFFNTVTIRSSPYRPA